MAHWTRFSQEALSLIHISADAMSCLAADPDMDQAEENVSLAFVAETFAMQVMQEELDETPVDEELGKLYEVAKTVREEAVGLLGSCFMLQRQLAPDAHEMLETEDNGSLTDREVVLMEDLRKAVVDAGFMDPDKERLFAAICDEMCIRDSLSRFPHREPMPGP